MRSSTPTPGQTSRENPHLNGHTRPRPQQPRHGASWTPIAERMKQTWRVCTHVYTRVGTQCIHVQTRAHACVYTHTYVHTYIHTHVHTYKTDAHADTHIHIHAHTHMGTRLSRLRVRGRLLTPFSWEVSLDKSTWSQEHPPLPLFNTFAEKSFIHQTIHPFKVYNSMGFNLFTELGNHDHN